MKRTTLGVLVALGALSLGTAASACPSAVPHPTLPGETDAQLAARGKRLLQERLRAEADAVFLAQVSEARTTGSFEADFTLNPLFVLYDTAPPTGVVVMRSPVLPLSCGVQPELGRLYVVYANRGEAGWRVDQLIRHEDFQDPPPGMPTARDVARRMYAPPDYPAPTP